MLGLIPIILGYDLKTTLSYLGTQSRAWFILFGFATGVAVFLNIKFFAHKTGVKQGRVFHAVLSIGCIAMFSTVLVNSGAQSGWMHAVHNLSAQTFGAVCFGVMFALLFVRCKKERIYFLHITALTAAAMVVVASMLIIGWAAQFQLSSLLVSLVVLLISNYLTPHRLTR